MKLAQSLLFACSPHPPTHFSADIAFPLDLAKSRFAVQAGGSALAKRFADCMGGKPARAVMTKYGCVLPGAAATANRGMP